MAYRKTSRRKFQYSQVVPVWTRTHTDTVNLAVQAMLAKLGVTDVPSYFRQLRVPVAISVVVCASFGATNYGITGFLVGGLLGLVAPVALVWLAVLLAGIAIFLGIYCLAWAVIWAIFRWLLAG